VTKGGKEPFVAASIIETHTAGGDARGFSGKNLTQRRLCVRLFRVRVI
jgi:hypothetical protein